MSLRQQQQETGKGSALVLVNSPAVKRQVKGPAQIAGDHVPKLAQTPVIVAARSVFLAQLSSQYETKGAARARRMDARAFAAHCYDEKPPKPTLRHLLWA